MAETEEQQKEQEEASPASRQLAVKTWSVIARYLHEGSGIVTLHKAWDSQRKEIILFPSYAGQTPEALKPRVWMSWRHELKPPLGGHTFIRDVATVVDSRAVSSPDMLAALEAEYALTRVEALRRFQDGEPGLVAVVLRVHHLPRAYKFYDVASTEGSGEQVPLPFDVAFEDLIPAIEDSEFERRYARVRSALERDE